MTTGERIRSIRTAKGLTQKDLGVLCGMADSAIRRYELDRGNPTERTLSRIADALGVSSGELIGVDQCPYDMFGKVAEILKRAGLSFESSSIFDDYYVWPTDSQCPEVDKVEITFSDLTKIALSVEKESEAVKQQFIKEALYQKLFKTPADGD